MVAALRGEVPAAQAALAGLGGLRASEDPQDQAFIAVAEAFTAAALGQPAAALRHARTSLDHAGVLGISAEDLRWAWPLAARAAHDLADTATETRLLALLDGYRPGRLAPMQRAERDLARARLAAAADPDADPAFAIAFRRALRLADREPWRDDLIAHAINLRRDLLGDDEKKSPYDDSSLNHSTVSNSPPPPRVDVCVLISVPVGRRNPPPGTNQYDLAHLLRSLRAQRNPHWRAVVYQAQLADDEAPPPSLAPQLIANLDPRVKRHADIQNDQIGPRLLRRVDQRLAVLGLPDDLELSLQRGTNAVKNEDMIVPQQYAHLFHDLNSCDSVLCCGKPCQGAREEWRAQEGYSETANSKPERAAEKRPTTLEFENAASLARRFLRRRDYREDSGRDHH